MRNIKIESQLLITDNETFLIVFSIVIFHFFILFSNYMLHGKTDHSSTNRSLEHTKIKKLFT